MADERDVALAQLPTSCWQSVETQAQIAAFVLIKDLRLATYAPFLRLATLVAGEQLGRRGRQPLASLGPPLAQAQLLAGALDAVENAALLGVLADARGDGLPRLAFGCPPSTIRYSHGCGR